MKLPTKLQWVSIALFVGASICFWTLPSGAADRADFLLNPGTQPVAIYEGDTINTYSVSVASNSSIVNASSSTLIRPAVTDRSRRLLCIQNMGAVTVNIGSSTVATSDLFTLGESTSTAIKSQFCTHSSAAIYGAAKATAPAQTVVVIEETQSIP